jgi:hypothetical protein
VLLLFPPPPPPPSLLVHGQRLKEGCYNAATLSCQASGGELPEWQGDLVELQPAEQVCVKLALEVFPTEAIVLDPSPHAEYLNGIDATSECCTQIQRFYHQCLLCVKKGLGYLVQYSMW